jgi:hypothetical protein
MGLLCLEESSLLLNGLQTLAQYSSHSCEHRVHITSKVAIAFDSSSRTTGARVGT